MQTLTAAPRDALTADQVRSALTAPVVSFGYGVDLLDGSLNYVRTVGVDECTVRCDATANVPFTLDALIDYEPVPTDRLRPWFSISDGIVTAVFREGVYAPETPSPQFGTLPLKYHVIGYDCLSQLNRPISDNWITAPGAVVLDTEIPRLLTAAGFGWPVRTDTTGAGKTYAAGKTWPADGQTTWLTVLTDLLAVISYAAPWPDWDGNLRLTPYADPTTAPTEWAFVVGDPDTGIVTDDPQITRDVYATVNQWVFTMNNTDGDPVNGVSRVVINNGGTSATFTLGPSSQDALGGRINQASPQGLDAATYADLVTQGKAIALAAARATETIPVTSRKFPLLWHRDVASYLFDQLGELRIMQSTQWSLALHDLSAMTSTWQTVVGS